MVRARAACLAAVLALCPAASCKGTGLPTRVYARPSSPSNAYKYAGAAAAGAVVGYWAGSRYYSPSYHGYTFNNYNNYRNHYSGQDPSWSSRYAHSRNTNCNPGTNLYPRPEQTEAWVWMQFAIGLPWAEVQSVTFETDLFRDLSFRSPCNLPTQVIVSRICSKNTKSRLTESDMANPSVCTYQGGTDSVHSAARRKLLAGTITIVEFAVGIDDSAMSNDMQKAIQESFNDQYSSIYTVNQMNATHLGNTNTNFLSSEFQLAPGGRAAAAFGTLALGAAAALSLQ